MTRPLGRGEATQARRRTLSALLRARARRNAAFRRRITLLAALLVLGTLPGCGGESAPDEVARCITERSGTLLTDPLNEGPVNFGLGPVLRDRADAEPRVGDGSILPRPTAFAAFLGSDPTFVPPDFDGSGFVPAAFVFFDTPESAQAHEDEADLRRGSALIVFHGEPPAEQQEFIDDCL